jgi:hypothetical protein
MTPLSPISIEFMASSVAHYTNYLYLNDDRLGDAELERNATDPLLAPTAIPITSGFTIHLCGS